MLNLTALNPDYAIGFVMRGKKVKETCNWLVIVKQHILTGI